MISAKCIVQGANGRVQVAKCKYDQCKVQYSMMRVMCKGW